MPYINERWLGGMLTNFNTIAGRVKKMQEYERMRAAGDFDAMPKKEALILTRELDKLQRNLGGIRDMTKLPDAVFVIDTKKEHIAVTEANKLGLPIVAVVDTNCDPDLITYVIPGNDDAIRAGTLMCRVIADAVEEGRFIASRRAARAGAPGGRRARPVVDPEEEARRAEQQRDARRQAALAQAEREARLAARAGRPPRRRQAPRPRRRPPARGASLADRATGAAGSASGAGREPRSAAGGARSRPDLATTPRSPSASADGSPTVRPPNHTTRGVEAGPWQSSPPGCKGAPGRHRSRDDGRQEGADGDRRRLRGRGGLAARARARQGGRAGRTATTSRARSRWPSADNAAALVELKSESDFVAKSPQFVEPGQRAGPGRGRATAKAAVDDHKDAIDDLQAHPQGEHRGRAGRPLRGRAGPLLDTYLHVQNGRGVNGVIVELAGGTPELAHDIAVHIAFGRPAYLSRDDVPADEVAAERAALEAQTRNEGKPEQALPKIVEGKLNGWYKRVPGGVLLEQPYAKDDKQTVAQVLGGANVVRFAQAVVGA